MIDSWYAKNLVCPRDHSQCTLENNVLYCEKNHSYPVVDGVPVMLLEEKKQTMDLICNSIKRAKGELIDTRAPELYLESLGVSEKEKALIVSSKNTPKIDPVVDIIIAATSGNLYKSLAGKLECYPIPHLRLEAGRGKRLLDIGCNWGRWSIAAHRIGYRVVGVDPSLGAIMAARRVSKSLNFDIKYVVADARFLPFDNSFFDVIFSYSVLQHFSKEDVQVCLSQVRRLLEGKGYSYIQMANKYGLRSFYHQLRRGFRAPAHFEVRYWTPRELLNTFNTIIGKTTFEVDGYFGLGIQRADLKLMAISQRCIILFSEMLRGVSTVFKPFRYGADSLYLRSYVA